MKAFPALAGDMETATDLYALGQNLACAFYLMRIMEVGVQRFGKKLGVSPIKRTRDRLADLSWHQILNDLNPKLNALPRMTAKAKEKHEKISAIQSYLFAVKDAWRNPTMHPRKGGYTDPEMVNLLTLVRSSMNELASVVSPQLGTPAPKPRKTGTPTPSIARAGVWK